MTSRDLLARGQLERVEVRGFRSIRNMDLELGALNVLIGANGAGKSNFIEVFKFMRAILNRDMQLYVGQRGGAERFLHFGSKTTDEIFLAFRFNPNAYWCHLRPTIEDRLIFASEYAAFEADRIGYHGGTKERRLGQPGSMESGLPQERTLSFVSFVAEYMESWSVYHFHDTSETAHVKKTALLADSDYLRADAGNLAAFLASIRSSSQYQSIVLMIQRVAPFFQDFVLEPEKNNPGTIRLRWKHRGTDAYFDASDLSDGTLRFICLSTLLLQPALPRTIILDEPELGLHPYALQLLAGLLRSAASRTQVIASTQSVTLANQLTPADIIVVDRVDEASQFRRLSDMNLEAWLGEYAIGDLWEKNLIGGVPT